ncbi:MAG: 2-oxoacid:acceptor oxidoreductase family protein, partial [Desulfovibrio sp.]|nr:2-oxoacid:acceptor oxidoreductase family protein [Desulfovibrio sp.]
FLPCRSLGREAGSVQSGGTALLGAACASGLLPVSFDDLTAAIRTHLPAKIQEVNLAAAELGRAALA